MGLSCWGPARPGRRPPEGSAEPASHLSHVSMASLHPGSRGLCRLINSGHCPGPHPRSPFLQTSAAACRSCCCRVKIQPPPGSCPGQASELGEGLVAWWEFATQADTLGDSSCTHSGPPPIPKSCHSSGGGHDPDPGLPHPPSTQCSLFPNLSGLKNFVGFSDLKSNINLLQQQQQQKKSEKTKSQRVKKSLRK